jgi:hypothetical protein
VIELGHGVYEGIRIDLQTVQTILQVKDEKQGVVLVETFEWYGCRC